VELAGGLGVEAEAGETALHVAALAAVQPDLVFGGLVGVLGKSVGGDGGGQVPRRAGLTGIAELGDAAERQRLERAVRIAGEVGVELFRLVGVLHRAPELDFHRGRGRSSGSNSGRSRSVGGLVGRRSSRVEVNL